MKNSKSSAIAKATGILLCIALWFTWANAARSDIFNAGADLVANEVPNGSEANPNGTWSYGKATSATSAGFTLLPTHTDALGGDPSFQGWLGGESACCGISFPVEVANVTGATVSGIPSGSMLIHPANGDAANPFPIVRWTATAS